MKSWKAKVVAYLKQGITPEKLALSLALGVVLGIIPLLGTTTMLCLLAGHFARLNQPFLQAVNYFVYPLQILLLIPFYRMGEYLFQAPRLPVTVSQIQELMRQSLWNAITLLWDTTLHALAVWLLLAPVLCALLIVITNPVFRNWSNTTP